GPPRGCGPWLVARGSPGPDRPETLSESTRPRRDPRFDEHPERKRSRDDRSADMREERGGPEHPRPPPGSSPVLPVPEQEECREEGLKVDRVPNGTREGRGRKIG